MAKKYPVQCHHNTRARYCGMNPGKKLGLNMIKIRQATIITLSEMLVYKQADEPDKSKKHFEARTRE